MALRVTIITVCKNAECEIEKTVQSVMEQTYESLEYIIIDGASTDDTLKRLQPYHNSLQLYSEPDDGIYHAMNKGVNQSGGDYILFVNAGDILLHATVIERVIEAITKQRLEAMDVIYGNVLVTDPTTGTANIWKMPFRNRLTLYSSCLPHPATFHHRRAFEKNGLYDQKYKIAGDYEWFVRGYERNHLKFQHIDVLTTLFYTGGISYQERYRSLHHNEKQQIRLGHYSKRDRFWLNLGVRLKKNKLLR